LRGHQSGELPTSTRATRLKFRDGCLVDDQDAAEPLAGQTSAGKPSADGLRREPNPEWSGDAAGL